MVRERQRGERSLHSSLLRIWGGPAGYGPSRTRSMLTGVGAAQTWSAPVDKEVAPRLAEAARAVRRRDRSKRFG